MNGLEGARTLDVQIRSADVSKAPGVGIVGYECAACRTAGLLPEAVRSEQWPLCAESYLIEAKGPSPQCRGAGGIGIAGGLASSLGFGSPTSPPFFMQSLK
jgi:hypothetical protein